MKKLEFQTRPNGDVEVIEPNIPPYILSENHRELIIDIYDTIRNDYPDAFNALSNRYKDSLKNKRYFEFLLVRGFIKCNWSQYDDQLDITEKGRYNFEFCSCPMRGECPDCNVVCNPKISTIISPAEINVFRLIVDGKSTSEIASILFISPDTVHNHRNSILKKLDLHNSAALVDYWHTNKLK